VKNVLFAVFVILVITALLLFGKSLQHRTAYDKAGTWLSPQRPTQPEKESCACFQFRAIYWARFP
jgi:hypothetical protein